MIVGKTYKSVKSIEFLEDEETVYVLFTDSPTPQKYAATAMVDALYEDDYDEYEQD